MSAVCKNKAASENDLNCVLNIFSKIGKVIKCEEKDIDAITGVSGSGPAFYYYIIDQIAKAGEKSGLNYETALTLSAQTALGAAKMILETGQTPQELITAVTTPGGTTAEGNKVLQNSEISQILFETVEKTAQKSKEMSK
jgi:pyrroline-5-carboxylate reductase